VICGLNGTESARSWFECFKNDEKLIVSSFLFLHKTFFIPLSLILDSLVFCETSKEYIFALRPTNSRGVSDPVSLLNFPTIR